MRVLPLIMLAVVNSFFVRAQKFEGNDLFEYLQRDRNSAMVASLNEHYGFVLSGEVMKGRDGAIEYTTDEGGLVSSIRLAAGTGELTVLPMGLRWQMSDADVKQLLGPLSGASYHYRRNMDLTLYYNTNGKQGLSYILLSYVDYDKMSETEKLFIDPSHFTYLADAGILKDEGAFTAELRKIIDIYASRQKNKLKGVFRRKDAFYKYYSSASSLPGAVSEEVEEFGENQVTYIATLWEMRSDAADVPDAVRKKYEGWMDIVKKALPAAAVQWTVEKTVYSSTGTAFRNKENGPAGDLAAPYKYPGVILYVERRKGSGTYAIVLRVQH